MVPTESFNDIIQRLVNALAAEKKCLLSAEYDELPHLSAEKERCLTYIERSLSGPDADHLLRNHARDINAMRRLAAENEKLLQATKTGVKSAQERLAHLNNIDSVVGTYTATGGQLRLEDSATTCKKIA